MKYQHLYDAQAVANEAQDEDIYNKDEAWRLMHLNGRRSFIPTNNARLNAFIAAVGVPVYTDSPNSDADTPYTDGVSKDVHMYYPGAFVDSDMYAHTLLHEVSHWLGTKTGTLPEGYSPLDMHGFTSKYAVEEITAELTAEVLAQEFGLPPHPVRGSYLHNYVKSLDRAASSRNMTEQEMFFAAFTGKLLFTMHDEAYTIEQWELAEQQAEDRLAYARGFIK